MDALKQLGVTDIVSVSAVGSLKEDLPPGKFVIVDQFIDRTYLRDKSFFGKGCVAHVSLAHPTCNKFSDIILKIGKKLNIEIIRMTRSTLFFTASDNTKS